MDICLLIFWRKAKDFPVFFLNEDEPFSEVIFASQNDSQWETWKQL